MSTTRSRLDERYGVSKSASKSRAAKVGLWILAIGFVATVLWVAWVFIAGNQIKANTLRYEHVSDSQISVDFSVTMPPGTAATCGIEAFNDNRGQVGFTVVDIPAQKERVTSHRVVVTTQQKAVSGAVKTCEKAE